MQSMYHWIGHIKNSNNAITGCKLQNLRTGQVQEIPVERLKDNMKEFKRRYPNDDLVDNLSLKIDGRFQVKDNILDEYIRACQTIGIQPLEIEKTRDGYVIVDIPSNLRNIQIPKFVHKININKRLNGGLDGGNNRQQENNKDLDTKLNILIRKLGEQVNLHNSSRASLDEQKGLLEEILNKVSESHENDNIALFNEQKRLLDLILEKIEHFENSQESTNSIVEGHLTDLKGLMEEIKEDDSNEETLRLCEELKNEIEENGRKILDTKNKLETECSSLAAQYNEILEIPESAGFINGNSEPCTNDNIKYKGVMQANNIDVYIPFDKLEILRKWLEFYYHVLTSMKLIIDSTDINMFKDFEESQRTDTRMKSYINKIKNGIYNFNKNPMDGIENASIEGTAFLMQASGRITKVAGGKAMGSAVSSVGDTLMKANAKKKANAKCEKLDLLKKQYESEHVIDGFYGETDRDTAIYVLEEKYAPRNLRIKAVNNEVKKDLEYKEILRLFDDNMQIEDNRDSLNHIIFDEETKKRIALAYICARKIIRGSTNVVNGMPTEIPLAINPQCQVEWLSEIKINISKDEINEIAKIKRLYYAIILEVMYANLLIEGFEARYARKEIIDKLRKIFENGIDGHGACGRLYTLKPNDMRNLRFDLQTYV